MKYTICSTTYKTYITGSEPAKTWLPHITYNSNLTTIRHLRLYMRYIWKMRKWDNTIEKFKIINI